MAAVTAAVTGVVAVGASVYGGMQQADAARKAGQAANSAAASWNSYNQAMAQQALESYNQYVPGMQASIDKAIQAQTVNLARTQKLVDSIDPALLEAGKQTKQLLEGESAPVLANLQQQRQTQRQQMLDSLRQQIGPGAETSSMGQNMMMKFDSETSNIMNAAQQSYLQQVSGLALDGGRVSAGTLSSMSESLAKLGAQWGDIGLNRARILEGSLAATDRAYEAQMQAAGGQAAGQYAEGALWQNIGKGIGTLGGVAGAYQKASDSNTSGGIEGGYTQNNYTMPEMGSQYNMSQPSYLSGSLASNVSSQRAPVGTYNAPSVPSVKTPGGFEFQ